MDFLRGLDYGLIHALATYTVDHPVVALAVYIAAQGLIVVPVISLYFLWKLPEPISHKHGNQKAALMAVMSLFLALAIKSGVAFLWFRARPFLSHPDMVHLPIHVDPSSFPSGHTIIAFAIAISLQYSGVKKWASWLMFAAVLIGLGRVMAGVHYPSDVIGGILIAWASAWYIHREASSIRKFLPDH